MKIAATVIPRSSHNELVKLPDGTYKARLTAPPVDGKANEALIELLSKEFHTAKSNIFIVQGKKGRKKIVEIKS